MELIAWVDNREDRPPQAFAEQARREGDFLEEGIAFDDIDDPNDEQIIDAATVNPISGTYADDKIHAISRVSKSFGSFSELLAYMREHPELEITRELSTLYY
jgi:hypothetical protein